MHDAMTAAPHRARSRSTGGPPALAALAACVARRLRRRRQPARQPADGAATPPRRAARSCPSSYFQKCIQPVFLAQLQINQNGAISTNTCAAAGCHDNATGTGGALRLIGSAQRVDMANPANTPDVIRTTDMYKNFYSAQGEVVFGAPLSSRLLTKPLTLNVLHGGGRSS